MSDPTLPPMGPFGPRILPEHLSHEMRAIILQRWLDEDAERQQTSDDGRPITVTLTDEQAGALYEFVAYPAMSMNTPIETKAREAINVIVAAVKADAP